MSDLTVFITGLGGIIAAGLTLAAVHDRIALVLRRRNSQEET